jgi:hypothetical protein
LKEIDIGELLHLLDVGCFGNLFVVEENPCCGLLVGQLFAYKRNIVTVDDWLGDCSSEFNMYLPCMDGAALVADDRLQLEVSRKLFTAC